MSALDNTSRAQLGAFVDHVRKTGGASMNVGSGQLVQPGVSGFFVGAEPDTEGNRIPTTYVPADKFGPEHVEAAMDSIRRQTGGRPGTHVGAWTDGKNVELDASARHDHVIDALITATDRQEKAIFDNRRQREIPTRYAGIERDTENDNR